jgi:DNA-binding GntR family transcriptional regulator
MPQIQPQPTLVEQVVNAIVSEILDGDLPSNARLIQDELARAYGVSRQPVQQALLLLRDRGLVREAPGRGLIVSRGSLPSAAQNGQRPKGRRILKRAAPR